MHVALCAGQRTCMSRCANHGRSMALVINSYAHQRRVRVLSACRSRRAAGASVSELPMRRGDDRICAGVSPMASTALADIDM